MEFRLLVKTEPKEDVTSEGRQPYTPTPDELAAVIEDHMGDITKHGAQLGWRTLSVTAVPVPGRSNPVIITPKGKPFMTTTAEAPPVERKHGGMPKWAVLGVGRNHEGRWVRYWPCTSDIDGERFLTRFMPLRTPWVSVDITRIHMDDTSRPDPHDHSRTFLSWKAGWYSEWVFYDKNDLTKKRFIRHRRFGIHRLRHTQAHTITEVSPKLFTVLFLGPERQASNYWTPAGLQSTGMGVDQQEEWA